MRGRSCLAPGKARLPLGSGLKSSDRHQIRAARKRNYKRKKKTPNPQLFLFSSPLEKEANSLFPAQKTFLFSSLPNLSHESLSHCTCWDKPLARESSRAGLSVWRVFAGLSPPRREDVSLLISPLASQKGVRAAPSNHSELKSKL